MKIEQIQKAYFVGIAGIGMSALARYLQAKGVEVYGYDRVRSAMAIKLEEEGFQLHYSNEADAIPEAILHADPSRCLVVYTPAIPASSPILQEISSRGLSLMKRAEVLGLITHSETALTVAVAGTHGKTSTSCLLAHLLHECGIPTTAFLGGISVNVQSNLMLHPQAKVIVVEADEYDRSFLQLKPEVAIVSSVDADHLDIYGSHEGMGQSFQAFADLLPESGLLVHQANVDLHCRATKLSYSVEGPSDARATGIDMQEGKVVFSAKIRDKELKDIEWEVPGRHNVENALAAISVALHLGAEEASIARAMRSYRGVKRRFETHVRKEHQAYIDDYAHHPTEIQACIGAAKELYPSRRITGIFQPHLYSRTRDFGDEFARSLEALNELLLMEIYPAREEPIPGIDSGWLLNKIQMVNKKLVARENIVDEVLSLAPEVLLTMGAGDIDQLVEPIKTALDDTSK